MLTPWPRVVGEEESLRRVVAGMSIARYGDGELNLCLGANCKSQVHHSGLSRRLREILRDLNGGCAVGIPNVEADTKPFWNRYKAELYAKLMNQRRVYLSAFISRPDSAPWIHTPAYWQTLESLWRGRDVTLVRGSRKSLTASMLTSAASVKEIVGPARDAWKDYDRLLDRVGTPKVALLCLGPTATVMAMDLSRRGVHAVDLGHVGMWMRRLNMAPEVALAEGRREP